MPKLIPIAERHPMHRCWFCGTGQSVKYTGEIMNPCPWADNRYKEILICNKCALNHAMDLKDYWIDNETQ